MGKSLDQMTNDELGVLFPIIISEHDPDWIRLYNIERVEIIKVLGEENIARIEHIGSTAIPNLKAKPTIDILVEIVESTDNAIVIDRLAKLEYHYIPRPENPVPHMMFVKGYSVDGFKGQAYHIHVRYSGDWDELYFRDYLKMNPAIAQEYGILKTRLAEEYRNDRDGYTDKKTEFIKRITDLARKNE